MLPLQPWSHNDQVGFQLLIDGQTLGFLQEWPVFCGHSTNSSFQEPCLRSLRLVWRRMYMRQQGAAFVALRRSSPLTVPCCRGLSFHQDETSWSELQEPVSVCAKGVENQASVLLVNPSSLTQPRFAVLAAEHAVLSGANTAAQLRGMFRIRRSRTGYVSGVSFMFRRLLHIKQNLEALFTLMFSAPPQMRGFETVKAFTMSKGQDYSEALVC